MDNEERILLSGMDPLQDGAFWLAADKPFQALAACMAWAGYKLMGDDYVCHLPVAMDGSCSGLQHFSALLRDEVGGAAVNLVPGDKPSDIYTQVGNRAQVLSDSSPTEWSSVWRGKVSRKIAKQPTMTLCYSATKFGMQGQLGAALRKLDEDGPYLPEGVDRHQASVYMANHVWDAIGDVVVAAKTAMTWLQQVSSVAAKAGLPVRWTSPIGFPVLQDYRESIGKRVEAFFGGQSVKLTLVSDSEKLSRRRQASGIAPNFVHSLDASHLMGTVNLAAANGITSVCVIHDSFATHASDTTLLNAVLREAFVKQYEAPLLESFREEIIAQLLVVNPALAEEVPPLPPFGNLDLDAVRKSDFFFA